MGTTIKNAALEISKRNRVLFIGPPLQRSFQLLKINFPEVRKYWAVFRGKHPDLRQVSDNLTVFYPKTVLESINLIKDNRIYDFLLRVNEKRFARQILKAVQRLNFKDFDVAINPQLVNPLTDTNYPLKIDEYLSMGKPIVATKTRFMNYFGDSVYLAGTREEYVSLIETAIRENSPGKEKLRIDLARSHSWENFIGKIYKQIELLSAIRSNE
ncbi:MAG: hypothetical protein WCI48_11490 [Bacteroidota bacterium]|jgi:hypothetical protein